MPKPLSFVTACYRAVIIISVITGSILAQRKPTLAVLDFSPKGILKTEASILTDEIRSSIIASEVFRVLERAEIDEILKEQGFQATGSCDDQECSIEIGKLLGVQHMLIGSAAKLNKTIIIHARIVDVQTGAIVFNTSEKFRGDLDKIAFKGLSKFSDRIISKFKKIHYLPVSKKSGQLLLPKVPNGIPFLIDGNHVFAREVFLSKGKHKVVWGGGIKYGSLDTVVAIKEKTQTTLAFTPTRLWARLSIKIKPRNANIYINGTLHKDKLSKPLHVPTGRITIRAEYSGFETAESNLTLLPDSHREIKFKLQRIQDNDRDGIRDHSDLCPEDSGSHNHYGCSKPQTAIEYLSIVSSREPHLSKDTAISSIDEFDIEFNDGLIPDSIAKPQVAGWNYEDDELFVLLFPEEYAKNPTQNESFYNESFYFDLLLGEDTAQTKTVHYCENAVFDFNSGNTPILEPIFHNHYELTNLRDYAQRLTYEEAYLKGLACFAKSKYLPTVTYLSIAIQKNPNSYEVYLARAKAFRWLKDYDRMHADIQFAAPLKPNDSHALLKLSKIYPSYVMEGNKLQLLRSAVKADPKNHSLRLRLAMALKDAIDSSLRDEALKHFDILRTSVKHLKAFHQRRYWSNFAFLHHIKANYRDALFCYEKALAIDYDAYNLSQLGDCHLNLGDTIIAEQKFLEAIALEPTDNTSHRQLSEIYLEQGSLSKALFHANQALFRAARYDSTRILESKVRIFSEMRDYASAANTYQLQLRLYMTEQSEIKPSQFIMKTFQSDTANRNSFIRYFYKNSHKLGKEVYTRGKRTLFKGTRPNGIVKEYYQSSLWKEVPYHEGKMHGVMRSYEYYYENKQSKKYKYSEEEYRNGVIQSSKTFYQDGTLDFFKKYQNGLSHGITKRHYEDGSIHAMLTYRLGKLHGKTKIFNSRSKITKIEYYSNDILDSSAIFRYEADSTTLKSKHILPPNWTTFQSITTYYESGYPKAFSMYDNLGNLNGPAEEYYPNGTLKWKYSNLNGNIHGQAKLYDEHRNPIRIENYVNGTKEGWCREYYDNGSIKFQDLYKGDIRVKRKKYDAEGKLEFTQEY